MKRIKKKLIEKARKIRLIAMDVDGVLTDGGIMILNSGEEVKIWSAKDRLAVALLRHSNWPVQLAWITARKSQQVEVRARELGVRYIYQGCQDKKKAYEEIKQHADLPDAACIYIGDDLVDIPVLKSAGLSFCPSDAAEDVKGVVQYVTHSLGGKGVLREVVEIVLKAQGHWDKAYRSMVTGGVEK